MKRKFIEIFVMFSFWRINFDKEKISKMYFDHYQRYIYISMIYNVVLRSKEKLHYQRVKRVNHALYPIKIPNEKFVSFLVWIEFTNENHRLNLVENYEFMVCRTFWHVFTSSFSKLLLDKIYFEFSNLTLCLCSKALRSSDKEDVNI